MHKLPSAADEVTVILVTYNSRTILRETLPPLAALSHLTVVDNGSTDDTLATVQELAPGVRVLPAGSNLGFGRANNLALEEVRTPYALLLNPDCLLSEGAIDALVEAARRYPDAAILAPKLYDAPGRLGLCYRPSSLSRQPSLLLDPDGDLCSEFLTGAAMLLDMQKMRGVGFFDPWFFLYLEDDDLCLRVRRAGHSLVLVHDATAMHRIKRSSTPSRRLNFLRTYCMTLSKFYIQRKYVGRVRCVATVFRVGLGALLSLPLHAVRLDATRLLHSVARLAASLAAPVRLNARHCID